MHTTRLVVSLLLGISAAGSAIAADAAASAAAAAGEEDAEPATAQPLAAAPRWTASGGVETSGYRMSLSRGSIDLGLRFEPRTTMLRPTDMHAEPASVTLPTLSFELRSISATPASARTLAERALGTTAVAAESSVSKVGIEWKPAQSQVFFNGGLGVRLSGDDSVVMRLRKGTLGLYMKRSF